jgi:methionine-S-sulfoxide reductase
MSLVPAGCFWSVELVYQREPGVLATEVGYTGGHKEEPTYKETCTGATGHAEAVQIKYDPSVVSYSRLLDVFFGKHDPTTKDRQGGDVGSQYRSGRWKEDAAWHGWLHSADLVPCFPSRPHSFSRSRHRFSVLSDSAICSNFLPH